MAEDKTNVGEQVSEQVTQSNEAAKQANENASETAEALRGQADQIDQAVDDAKK